MGHFLLLLYCSGSSCRRQTVPQHFQTFSFVAQRYDFILCEAPDEKSAYSSRQTASQSQDKRVWLNG